jgi:uncharacterized protein
VQERPCLSLCVALHLSRQRWRWLGVALAVAVVASLGALDLRFGHGYRQFIEPRDPSLATADAITTEVAGGRETLTLIYRPATGNVFESTSMLQLAKLADIVGRLEHVTSPQSLVTAHKLVALSDYTSAEPRSAAYRVVPLVYPDGLFDDAGLYRLRQDVASMPTVFGRLVARDGSSASVLIPFDLGSAAHERASRLSALQERIGQLESDLRGLRDGDRLVLAGPALFEFAVEEIMVRDLKTLAPASMLVFFALLLFLFRSLASTCIVLSVVFLACLTTLGLVGWAGMQATILVFSGLILVSTLSIAEALHVMTTVNLARVDGRSSQDAIVHSLDINLWPIVTTSATTLIGEAVLLYSASPAIRDMGLVMMVGAFFALFFTLAALPALASLHRSIRPGWVSGFGGVIDRMAHLCAGRPWRVLGVWALVCAVVLPGLWNLRSFDTMSGWFGSDTAFRQGLDLLSDNYVALGAIDVLTRLETADREAVAAYPALRAEREHQDMFDATLSRVPGIQAVITPSSALRGFEQRSAVADNGLRLKSDVVRDAPTSSPVGLAMLEKAHLLTPSGNGRDVWLHRTLDAGTVSNAAMVDIAGQAQAASSQLPKRETLVGGLPVVFASLGQSNMGSISQGTLITVAAITACLAVALRSLRGALIGLLPNVVPVALVFGVWGMWSGEINLAATTVLSIALGIVVDDTTHIMMKHQRFMAQGFSPAQASRLTIVQGAPPIIVTTIILASGFLILSQSDFALTSQQSLMIAASICVAVVFDLTLTPALLAIAAERRPAQGVNRDAN